MYFFPKEVYIFSNKTQTWCWKKKKKRNIKICSCCFWILCSLFRVNFLSHTIVNMTYEKLWCFITSPDPYHYHLFEKEIYHFTCNVHSIQPLWLNVWGLVQKQCHRCDRIVKDPRKVAKTCTLRYLPNSFQISKC